MLRLMSCFGTLGVKPSSESISGEKGNWKLCWKTTRWDWELPDLFYLLKGQAVNQAAWRSSEMRKLDSHTYRKSWIVPELPGKWRSAVIVVFTWWWPHSSYWSALKMCSLAAPQSWVEMGSVWFAGNAWQHHLAMMNNWAQGTEPGLFSLSWGKRFALCSECFYTFLAEADKLQTLLVPKPFKNVFFK